jgi:hypothetical protein
LRQLTDELINAAGTRLVFLVGLEEDRVGFEIRSLQEFMAAEGLVSGSDKDAIRRLETIAPIAFWRNAFLFASGKIFAERQHLRDSIYTICSELNTNETDEVVRNSLAGSFLALDLLEDGPARHQPKYARLFTTIAIRLLDAEASDLSMRLSSVYGDQLEDLYRDALRTRLGSSSKRIPGGAWHCLLALHAKGVAWAEGVAEEAWPTSAEEQGRLVSLSLEVTGESWINSRLAELVPVLPMSSMSGRGHQNQRQAQADQPRWLRSAMQIIVGELGSSAVRVQLPGLARNSFDVRLSSCQLASDDIRADVADMPVRHDDSWIPWIANAEFIRQPSREALGIAARTIFETGSAEYSGWRYRMLSWPLQAVVGAWQEGTGPEALVDAIESGRLGDVGDWVRAEERWRTQGFELTDIQHADTCAPLPFDSRIGDIGLPNFGLGWWIVGGTSAASAPTNSLFEIYAGLSDRRLRQLVAQWLMLHLVVTYTETTTRRRTAEETITVEFLNRLLDDLSWGEARPGVYANLARLVLPATDESIIEFLDKLGMMSPLYSIGFHTEERGLEVIIDELLDYWIRTPVRTGLMRLASKLLEQSPFGRPIRDSIRSNSRSPYYAKRP